MASEMHRGALSLSPNGESVAYSVYNGYTMPPEIRISPLGSSSYTTVYSYSPAKAEIAEPRWSPDGTKLIFEIRRFSEEPKIEIDAINIDGTGLITLASDNKFTGYFASPTYSPDGSTIAFLAPGTGGEVQLFVANADGSDPHAITNPAVVYPEEQPRFSPDGKKIAFSGSLAEELEYNARIYTVNIDGSDLTEVTHGYGANEEWEFAPEWTPDGSKIVYGYEVNERTEHGGSEVVQWELYAANPDGSEEGTPFLPSSLEVNETEEISFAS